MANLVKSKSYWDMIPHTAPGSVYIYERNVGTKTISYPPRLATKINDSIFGEVLSGPNSGRITYAVGGNRRYKFCDHIKVLNHDVVHYPILGMRATAYTSGGAIQKDVIVNFPSGLPDLKLELWGAWMSPYTEKKLNTMLISEARPSDSEISVAFHKCLQDNKVLGTGSMNMLAFIGELKDLKSLLTIFQRKAQDVSSWKFAADKNLGVQFGVLPLASDLAKIFELWSSIERNLASWNDFAKQGKIMNAHATIPGDTFTDSYSWTQSYREYHNPLNFKYYVKVVKNISHTRSATKVAVYFRPKVFDLSGLNALRASIYGLKNWKEALWQLFPWSFVIDWIANVQDFFIDPYEQQPTLEYEVQDAGYSTTVLTHIDTKLYFRIIGEDNFVLATHCKQTIKNFYREAVPDLSSHKPFADYHPVLQFNTTGWSANRIGLAASLLIQKA